MCENCNFVAPVNILTLFARPVFLGPHDIKLTTVCLLSIVLLYHICLQVHGYVFRDLVL